MNFRVEYDRSDPLSIEKYSKRLIGKSFREIEEEYNAFKEEMVKESKPQSDADVSEKKRNKGNLGQLIEEKFFHYDCNNDSRPDFYEAGVELKVSPYKINKNSTLSAKERLILTKIDYIKDVNEQFENSHMWNKSHLLLLVYYLYDKAVKYNLDYRIGFSQLFTPPPEDVKIIKHDYDIIISKIRDGKAHELSEGDTLYLGAVTKAATSADRTKQPFSDIPAKPRAFAFKNSYMTYVLNHYIVPGKKTYEPIVTGEMPDSFEEYVVQKIEKYSSSSVDDLCAEFDVDKEKKPKNLEAILAYRMLGIKGNQAEEFVKANIVVKTIRIRKNGGITESMSFPAFKFKELAEEEWENSTFGNYLRETRFFFVVYKYDKNDILRLKGCQFWNIPYQDLETEVRQVWEKTRNVLREGLKVKAVNGMQTNNFPKASENRVCHVRPHARNAKDTDVLPDGTCYPKQCFWLNNTYIFEQLNNEIRG